MFWNLYEAGREMTRGDDRRWREQVAVVQRHRPDILCITEGWEWDLDDEALFNRAREEFGYAHGELYVAKSGCHMAIMWQDPIRLVDMQRQPHSHAWWHGVYRATLDIPGQPEPLTVLGTHMNPFDPTLRRIEGSWLRAGMPAHRHGIIVMDANIIPPGDPEPPYLISTHFPGEEFADRVPLQVLTEAGLIDVGASVGDRSPTLGHYGRPAVRRSVRLDQAWTTPSVKVEAYRVIDDLSVDPELDHASDHRPIWVEIG